MRAADAGGRRIGHHRAAQAGEFAQHMHHALAVLERLGQRLAQRGLFRRQHVEAGHRQLDAVLLEAVDAREAGGRQELAVHPQVRVAARARPVGQLGVDALAVAHQRREQADVLALEVLQQLRRDAVGRLRLHRGAVVDAVLDAQLDVEQAQEVPDLGGGAHGALAAAARQALLDRDRRRNAVDRVHLGPARRLHDAARIGVERFEVAPLAFVEQDVEGQRRLARAADAGDHAELAARDVDRQVLQVVLARIDDLDRVAAGRRLRARRVASAPRVRPPCRRRGRRPVRSRAARRR